MTASDVPMNRRRPEPASRPRRDRRAPTQAAAAVQDADGDEDRGRRDDQGQQRLGQRVAEPRGQREEPGAGEADPREPRPGAGDDAECGRAGHGDQGR